MYILLTLFYKLLRFLFFFIAHLIIVTQLDSCALQIIIIFIIIIIIFLTCK